MKARALMIMGTGSDVGKSLIVAGLCRAFLRRGLTVMPFKPQNMSNNAAVSEDGGEIGRAQALQALAAGQKPLTAMNPVLLKPEGETGAQIILRGKRVGSMAARDYFKTRAQYLKPVLKAFSEVGEKADLVLVEGAGSASEINLRHNDIANFGFARAANVPVMLLGDIHRGGIIAALVGTLDVIDPKDAALVVATIVNRFHGDPELFEKGKDEIAQRTGIPCFGPVPHFAQAEKLPAEDVLALENLPQRSRNGKCLIAVPRLPRIANFDDLDPLKSERDVELTIVLPGQPLPLDADLIILAGSKATRSDLAFLRQQGWDIDIKSHIRHGGHVLGLCGGYQMLGNYIDDPDGLEGPPGKSAALGLLDVSCVLTASKQLRIEEGVDERFGAPLCGYHMHLGATDGPDCDRPFARIGGQNEGAISSDGLVMGTYLHGLFAADGFRRQFLADLGADISHSTNYEDEVEKTLDLLAAHLEAHLDLDAILKLSRQPQFR
ncbi:Cobyric acid synthase [hydrothermal vent metagenome]|uniref:Cobyric acid synthase n=1 Tax=hydrothermal vent metagenome TaxID=652676 RepID=A0A3B0TSI1_9ZZZZ